ncbi:MAG: LytR/AlgR family response regulator transcription factor [Acidobacteriota bacterium]|jgi:two-component system LytT family response regulator
MNTLIVDDEPLARQILREELVALGGISIIGEAEDGHSALAAIASRKPDLVFLDIQMPGMSGLDVLRAYNGGEHIPVFVFVTAFDEHALPALEAGAVDYLLKPVSQPRLERALDKARRLYRHPAGSLEAIARAQSALGSSPASPAPLRRIVGRFRKEYYLLDAEEVLAFQAEGELVWILTRKQKFLANQTLKAIQEKLTGLRFHRIHRNALVNLDHIRKMVPLSSGRWLLTLSGGQEFVVSKRQAHAVEGVLNC